MLIPPQEIVVAIVAGVIPTFLWLWFWLSEDHRHPEPKTMLIASFLVGALAVVITLPPQEAVHTLANNQTSFHFFLINSGIEEIIKFGLVFLFIALTPFVDEPIDYAIYLITGALGFAALENTLYLIDPVRSVFSDSSLRIMSLRFLGSTLLHATMAAILGLSLGLTWHKKKPHRLLAFFLALFLVTTLHAAFNFFIITGTDSYVLLSLVVLWVVAIITMYFFEHIKHIR